jgi:hypothetical protein
LKGKFIPSGSAQNDILEVIPSLSGIYSELN